MQPIISIRQLDFAYRESGFRLRIEELTVPAGESLPAARARRRYCI